MIETKNKSNSIYTVICESKKHWVAYVLPTIMMLLGIFFLLTFLKYYVLFGVIIILISIHKILEYKSVRWTLTENEVIVKSGFLPWRKSYFDIPFDNIYEAFYTHGFFADIFGYGCLYIRRTEGSTSSVKTTKMTNHKEITGKINSIIRQMKNNPLSNNVQPGFQNMSTTDELYKLNNLKQQGIITEEEFDKMKKKLIN